MLEMMEQRVMLSIDPTLTLDSDVRAAINPEHIGQLATVVDAVYAKAFATLPMAGGVFRAEPGNATKLQVASDKLTEAFKQLPTDQAITGAMLNTALANAFGTHLSDVSDSGSSGSELRLALKLDDVLFRDAALPWTGNLGLPRLGVNLTGELTAPTDDSSTLIVGLNKNGFYLDLSANRADLSFTLPGASVFTATDGPDTDVARGGKLFWMPLTAASNGSASFDQAVVFNQAFDVSGSKLSVDNLTSLTLDQSASGDTKGSANFHLTVGMDHPPADLAMFLPSIDAELSVTWNPALVGAQWRFDAPAAIPVVSYSNVQLGLGQLFDSYIGPVLHKVQSVLSPIKPAIEALYTPIPLLATINDMVHLRWDRNGDSQVNLKEVIISYVEINDPAAAKTAETFIDAAHQLYVLIDSLPDVGASGKLVLGGCGFDGDVRGPLIPGADPLSLNTGGTSSGANVLAQASSTGGSVTGFLSQFTNNALRPDASKPRLLSFSFLDDPSRVMGLFANQDVTLLNLDLPHFDVPFAFDLPAIGPFFGVLYINLGFGLRLSADLGLGYDTRGLADFAKGGYRDPGTLWNGLYINDWQRDASNLDGWARDAKGQTIDIPEVSLLIDVHGGASVGWQYLNASVTVHFGANVDVNLHEPNSNGVDDGYRIDGALAKPDGKIRYDEMKWMWDKKGVLGLFDLSGAFTAGLDVGLTALWWSWNWRVATLTLAQFGKPSATTQAPAQPKLATLDPDGTLRLHMGDLASRREDLFSSEIDETFTVVPGDAAGDVTVSAFGFSQSFKNVSRINANGGSGNDSVSILKGVNLPATLNGDDGDDTLAVFDGTAILHGGAGNDVLTGGTGADKLYGDDGNDAIAGFAGNDTLEGGAGSDTLNGDANGLDDTVAGSGSEAAGNDSICGGIGNDFLFGGPGDDYLDGGDGDDALLGDVAREIHHAALLPGEIGNDILVGGPGKDRLAGDDMLLVPLSPASSGIQYGAGGGNDTFIASLADDIVLGQGGDDLLTLAGTGTFDLRSEAIAMGDAKRLTGINRIDLNTTGADYLYLNVATVHSITDAGTHTLLVRGGPGDGVDLGEPWTVGTNEVLATQWGVLTCRVFSAGANTVKIGAGVDATLPRPLSKGLGVTAEPISFTSPYAGADSTSSVIWSFGDGTTLPSTSVNTPGALAPTHIYYFADSRTRTARFPVNLLISERDGGNTTFTDSILVYDMVQIDGVLSIGGTAGNDFINVSDRAGKMLNVFRWGTLVGIFPNTGRPVRVFGGAGDDTLDASDYLSAAVESYGGDGNDLMRGGAGDDMLFGEAGNDRLDARAGNDILVGGPGNDIGEGGNGNDLMIGGLGSDSMLGRAGDDLLIAGYTDFDAVPSILSAALSTWNLPMDYDTRTATLRYSFFKPGVTVHDGLKTDVDWLTGGTYGLPDRDYFFGSIVTTKYADRFGNERIEYVL